MAKPRKLNTIRMKTELIEDGIKTIKREQQDFFDLAERFRRENDPEASKRLGEQLGRAVCASQCPRKNPVRILGS